MVILRSETAKDLSENRLRIMAAAPPGLPALSFFREELDA
jgi:hypothetical protein